MSSKLREALENARSLIYEGIKTEVKDDIKHPFHLELAIDKIVEALAEPVRNCDVGTAEEQGFRFYEFCRSHWGKNGMLGDNCAHCPLDRFNCRLEWAQMPYETVKTNKTKTNKGEWL